MTIHFGNDFDGPVWANHADNTNGNLYAGPHKLLQWLEAQLGMSGYPNQTDYLRIELYRQSLDQIKDAFFQESFQTDRFATAACLLSWRDELLCTGWDFSIKPGMPERLKSLAEVEAIYQKKIAAPELMGESLGFADRYAWAFEQLRSRQISLDEIILYEPVSLHPPLIQRLLTTIEQYQPSCTITTVEAAAKSSLPKEVIILKCRRDSDAAVFVAQLIRENPSFKPVVLASQSGWMLEQALSGEGLPALGIPSASLARPSLQVLKLAPYFLWEPVDVFKVMEFLTLPVKPLDPGLSLEIARVMAAQPGFFSDTWFAAVYGYLEQSNIGAVGRQQYDFWFNRRRYPLDKTAPIKDAAQLYAFLQDWAIATYDESGGTQPALLVLAEQARKIHALLEALPEQRISFLELERIVRTIFEAIPTQLTPGEAGAMPFIHKAGAIADPVSQVLWWNFVENSAAPGPDIWRLEERQYLEKKGVKLMTLAGQSRLHQWLQERPLRLTSERLVLVCPEQVDGAETAPHLLMSDLSVALQKQFEACVYHIDRPDDLKRLADNLAVPDQIQIIPKPGARSRPHLTIRHPERIPGSEYETPTNLESLFYYPHRWFFRQKLRLYPAAILSITSHNTLMGNLAHKLFEQLLKQDFIGLDKAGLFNWIDQKAAELLPKEGATLLLYGREPEKNAFLRRVKNAAWNLVSLIRNNQWQVVATEADLAGQLMGVPVRGKADLILKRDQEQAIIDFKWSGATRRKMLILNGEDLQLVLYSRLLPPDEVWPHTAYFILEEGKMIARNNQAFAEATQAATGSDHAISCAAIFDRMLRTFQWRLEQIQAGLIEIRTARHALELEAMYEGQLFDLLEMKNEDAKWDDYRILIS